MIQNAIPTILDATTIDVIDFAGIDRAALTRLNPDTISVPDFATWLYDHGAAHLSAIERLELAERLTRRRFIIGAGGLLGAAALGACGAGEEAAEPTATATKPFTDSTGRTVAIPAEPQRVVALHDFNVLLIMLALGVRPIGSVVQGGEFARVSGLYDVSGIEPVGERTQPNVEQIALLQPDLLIGAAYDGQPDDSIPVEQMQTIAPTIFIDPTRSVEEVYTDYGSIFNLETKVEQQQAAYEARVQEIQEAIAPKLDNLMVAVISTFPLPESQVLVFRNRFILTSAVLRDLGVAGTDAEQGDRVAISIELLPTVDADVIINLPLPGDPSYTTEPLFETLNAAQAGQIYEVDGVAWSEKSYRGLNRVLDGLEEILVNTDPTVFP